MDVNAEVEKAVDIMAHHGIQPDVQREVVRILIGAGVEHCLNEQEKVRAQKNALIDTAHAGLVH